jgi:ketosteroid isomerase-like protein
LKPLLAENVEKTRAFIEAYNRRDFEAAVESFHPAIDWVLPAQQSSDSCCGPEEIIGFWDRIDETMAELRLEPQEWVDAGDRVATRLRHHGRGRESGVVIDEELYHQVATFRDGTIVRLEYFIGWDQALEAAGLAE